MPGRVASLNLISPDAAGFFCGAVPRWAHLQRAGSLGELRAVLEQRLDSPASPSTVDLIGHSTRDHLKKGGEPR
jgi:hypothetical protein